MPAKPFKIIYNPVFALFLILIVSACNSHKIVKAESEPHLPSADTRTLIDNYSKLYNNAGIVVAGTTDGKIFQYATGIADRSSQLKATTTSLFQIGSTSKMFTAIAIEQLIEAGKFSLHTPIEKFFRENLFRHNGNFCYNCHIITIHN